MFDEVKKILDKWGEWMRLPGGGVAHTLGFPSQTVEASIAEMRPPKRKRISASNQTEKINTAPACPSCKEKLDRDSQSYCRRCGWLDSSDRHMTFKPQLPTSRKRGPIVTPPPLAIVARVHRYLTELEKDKSRFVLYQVAVHKHWYQDIDEVGAEEAGCSVASYKTRLRELYAHIDGRMTAEACKVAS